MPRASGPGMRGTRRRPCGGGRQICGDKSLRPALRTTSSDGGRTSYWQGPEQTRQKAARTVFQALRGSPAICASRSKARPQAICPRRFAARPRKAAAVSLSSLLYHRPVFMFCRVGIGSADIWIQTVQAYDLCGLVPGVLAIICGLLSTIT